LHSSRRSLNSPLMQIETMTGQDPRLLGELQPEDWSDIIPMFEYYVRMPFCRPLKTVIESKIVGVGAAICLGATGWLAHIIVRPEFRNKGIGRAIVDALIDRLRESGCWTMLLISTDMGHPVYVKAGFVDQTDYVFFESGEPAPEYQGSGGTARFRGVGAEEILALDRRLSGEDRSILLVPTLRSSYVCRRSGTIVGYYLPGLGEGLIVAEDDEAGRELMRLKYSTSRKGVLPVQNVGGMDFLRENRFVETRRVKRMVLGAELRWHPERLYSRIGGNLG
jgi:GNAT superfamily N-acetyltransferase